MDVPSLDAAAEDPDGPGRRVIPGEPGERGAAPPRGFDPVEIRRKNEAFAPVPDLLLILDLDVDSALGRIGARGDIANEFEKRENLEKCRDIFLSLRGEPFVHVIPSTGSLDDVTAQVLETVQNALG